MILWPKFSSFNFVFRLCPLWKAWGKLDSSYNLTRPSSNWQKEAFKEEKVRRTSEGKQDKRGSSGLFLFIRMPISFLNISALFLLFLHPPGVCIPHDSEQSFAAVVWPPLPQHHTGKQTGGGQELPIPPRPQVTSFSQIHQMQTFLCFIFKGSVPTWQSRKLLQGPWKYWIWS